MHGLYVIASTAAVLKAASAYMVHVTNECSSTVWPAMYKFEDYSPLPNTTGAVLDSGNTWDVDVPTEFKGRMWIRTGCNSDATECSSGTVSGSGVEVSGISWTDSLTVFEMGYSSFTYGGSNQQQTVVDIGDQGFNIAMGVKPVNDTLGGTCTSFDCLESGCSGAFEYTTDYTKEHHCSIDADYYITLCPSSDD